MTLPIKSLTATNPNATLHSKPQVSTQRHDSSVNPAASQDTLVTRPHEQQLNHLISRRSHAHEISAPEDLRIPDQYRYSFESPEQLNFAEFQTRVESSLRHLNHEVSVGMRASSLSAAPQDYVPERTSRHLVEATHGDLTEFLTTAEQTINEYYYAHPEEPGRTRLLRWVSHAQRQANRSLRRFNRAMNPAD